MRNKINMTLPLLPPPQPNWKILTSLFIYRNVNQQFYNFFSNSSSPQPECNNQVINNTKDHQLDIFLISHHSSGGPRYQVQMDAQASRSNTETLNNQTLFCWSLTGRHMTTQAPTPAWHISKKTSLFFQLPCAQPGRTGYHWIGAYLPSKWCRIY